MMPSLLCLLFSDAFSDHACVFLCVSMHLETELLTHEEIPTQCEMATQEWTATQYDQVSDMCMANRPNMRGNPTAHRTHPSLPASQALAPCARQPGFRSIQVLLFAPKSTLHLSRHAHGETLHISILCAHNARVSERRTPGQSTTSIESSKVKNPNPRLHLIQHHLALLHASSRGKDRIGSSDLLDSGG